MKKRIIIFCFAAVLAAGAGTTNSYAAVNDAGAPLTEQSDAAPVQGGDESPVDYAAVTGENDAQQENSIIPEKVPESNEKEEKSKKLSGTLESILRALFFFIGLFTGGALMYAYNVLKNHKGANSEEIDRKINEASNMAERLKRQISCASETRNHNINSASQSFDYGRNNTEEVIAMLEQNISALEEKAAILNSPSASALNVNTVSNERPMTVSDMFNKVHDLRLTATMTSYLEYNRSVGRFELSGNPNESTYISEDTIYGKKIYVNRISPFNSSMVHPEIFNTDVYGNVKGDVLFEPCVVNNGVMQKGRIG